MNERQRMIRSVSQLLRNRSLVWAGLRSDDAESLGDLPQFSGAFSIIGGKHRRFPVDDYRYEDLTGVRMDVDTWDIDDSSETEATAEFRNIALRLLAGPSAVLPYRPTRFLSAIRFARRDRCIDLGLFGPFQSAFEHKPWVETELLKLGIPSVRWIYVADEEQERTDELLADGPIVVRRSRTSGGEGVFFASTSEERAEVWPQTSDGYACVARYYSEAVPLNIGATVWHDGTTVGHPSIQIIGIAECVNRRFGYCGNDFGSMDAIDAQTVEMINRSVHRIGTWLRDRGYRGTFGVDFLVVDGQPLFSEINPRFQGSTHLSAQISVDRDESCLFLDHIGAMLGMDAPIRRTLIDLTRDVESRAHLVVHSTHEDSRSFDTGVLLSMLREEVGYERTDVETRADIATEPGGVVLRATMRDRLTRSGFDLAPRWHRIVRDWVVSSGTP